MLVFGSAANMIGRQLLRTLLYICMTCELIASLGIGTALLFFHRTNPFSVLFSAAGTGHGTHWLFSSFFGVVAFVGFSFLGFESAGSIAEEVRESRRVLPKAITLSLLVAGILVMYASLGIVLSVPDIGAVISGQDANPIATTLETRLGSATGKVLLIMLTVGFAASLIGVQAAVTRAIWASARDKVLPGARLLGRLSGREHLPRYAIGLTAIIAGSLLFISTSKIYALLLSFANAGFYISYALPILGAVYLRRRGSVDAGRVLPGHLEQPGHLHRRRMDHRWRSINIAWPRSIYGGLVPELGPAHHDRHPRRARDRGLRPDLPARRPGESGPGRSGPGRPGRRRAGRMSEAPAAVITGAASGIGAACAALLRGQGWRTAGIDLHESDTDLPATVDVTDRAGVAAAVDAAAQRFGRLDLAVSAAGYYEEGIDVAEITREQWDRMLAVILGGTVNTCAAVLPHMLARDQGVIVAISSELALAGSATDLHYVAAKGAVLGFIKSLAMEVAQTGIRVNAVAPGPTDTPLLAPGLAVAPAAVPGHAAARPAGHARGDRRRGAITWPSRAPCTAAKCSRPTPGR